MLITFFVMFLKLLNKIWLFFNDTIQDKIESHGITINITFMIFQGFLKIFVVTWHEINPLLLYRHCLIIFQLQYTSNSEYKKSEIKISRLPLSKLWRQSNLFIPMTNWSLTAFRFKFNENSQICNTQFHSPPLSASWSDCVLFYRTLERR